MHVQGIALKLFVIRALPKANLRTSVASIAISTPSVEYMQDKALLVLTDVFGIHFIHNQLLIDSYASNGYKVIAPDLFRQSISTDELDSGTFDLPRWLAINGVRSSQPHVREVLKASRVDGVNKLAIIRFCYDARTTTNLSIESLVEVTVVTHPSLLKVPEDFETYREKSKVLLLINFCEIDSQFPSDFQEQADKILGDDKFAPGYWGTYWAGCTRGFAVRGDPNDPIVQAGKEGAFKASVDWFDKYL